jgi:hypothetical protein
MRCPSCEAAIPNVQIADVDLVAGDQPRYRGFVYLCPACQSILSVEMNALALQQDTVNQTVSQVEDLLDERQT